MTDPASISEDVKGVCHEACYGPYGETREDWMGFAIAAALDALFTGDSVRLRLLDGSAVYVAPSEMLAAVLDRADEGREDTGDERFGAGICVTGRGVEPCGEHGGCAR